MNKKQVFYVQVSATQRLNELSIVPYAETHQFDSYEDAEKYIQNYDAPVLDDEVHNFRFSIHKFWEQTQ